MVENILATLLGSYASVMIIFISSLYISRYLKSPHIFHFISIISSISLIFIFVYLKLQSSWFVHNQILAFVLSAYSIVLVFKFLELSFAYEWTYIKQMPLKLLVMYLAAFPRMPKSEAKLLELSNEDIRRESILSITCGIFQFIIVQTILYLIPIEWLALSSVSFPLGFRFLRYGLLTIILYLSIGYPTNFGFGIYSLLSNIPMNPVFPSFPFVSTSIRDFWSYRWNNFVKSSLHLMSFVIIPKLIDPIIPMSKSVKGLIAFALSGLIHEYAIYFMSSKWSGRNLLFFLLHGLLILFEIKIKLPAKPTTLHGKLIGWIWTIGIFLITSPLFFEPLIETGIFANMK